MFLTPHMQRQAPTELAANLELAVVDHGRNNRSYLFSLLSHSRNSTGGRGRILRFEELLPEYYHVRAACVPLLGCRIRRWPNVTQEELAPFEG